MQRNQPIDPHEFAAGVRQLLDENPRHYRNFGVYWFFVKALLKRVYDRHEMPLLGDYIDQSVIDRMPVGLTALELIQAAADEYGVNAALNMGRSRLEDPDGESFTLIDPDMGG